MIPSTIPNPRTNAFRKRFYPQVPLRRWNNWRWQLRNQVRDLAGLERMLGLADDEAAAVRDHENGAPIGITPYYASLLDESDSSQAIRRTMVPVLAERRTSIGELDDPLGEDVHRPVPGVIHTYPDKALFLVTDKCATYCRYCTRSRLLGGGGCPAKKSAWEKAIAYIESTPAIRDVLLSGGDPLVLSDERLEWLFSRLHAIEHVEFLRIGTKLPVVLPQRITPALSRLLRRYQPLWLSIHFTHPDELTPEVEKACARLADAGVPMGSQTVLLAGINDDPDVMRRLLLALLKMRVMPYYLHQCDPVSGSSHFRTPLERGLEILRSLHGHTTGYAVPHYMLDAPGGGGKVPLAPEYMVKRDGDYVVVRNYKGELYRYPDPQV